MAAPHSPPKVPSAHWLFRAAPLMRNRGHLHLTEQMQELGDFVDLNVPIKQLYSVTHPDYIKHVLITNNKNYWKDPGTKRLGLTLGNGLLVSEGDFWRRQRRIAQPAFYKESLSNMVDAMVSESLAAHDRIAQHEGPFDLVNEMMILTSDIAAKALFGAAVENNLEIGQSLIVAMRHTMEGMQSIIPPPEWLPTPRNLRFKKARKVLNKNIYGIIDNRRATSDPHRDLLAMLMGTLDEETGEGMTDRQLRDEVITLFSAGYETSANGLSWALYLLMKHPEVMARMRQEIKEVLGNEPPTMQHIRQLTYTKQVIDESLRLYPPAWVIGRQALAPDEIGGFRIKKGDVVLIPIYAMHRHEAFWPDPERFAPERFTPEAVKARAKFSYLPFGGGQRICIGQSFAMMEMQIALAMLVRSFEFELVEGQEIEAEPLITLRPKTGIWVKKL